VPLNNREKKRRKDRAFCDILQNVHKLPFRSKKPPAINPQKKTAKATHSLRKFTHSIQLHRKLFSITVRKNRRLFRLYQSTVMCYLSGKPLGGCADRQGAWIFGWKCSVGRAILALLERGYRAWGKTQTLHGMKPLSCSKALMWYAPNAARLNWLNGG
jgi:hypothetical protein